MLNVAPDSTQLPPATNNAASAMGRGGLAAVTKAMPDNATVDTIAVASRLSELRIRVLQTDKASDPKPNEAARAPNTTTPPFCKSRATRGIKAQVTHPLV